MACSPERGFAVEETVFTLTNVDGVWLPATRNGNTVVSGMLRMKDRRYAFTFESDAPTGWEDTGRVTVRNDSLFFTSDNPKRRPYHAATNAWPDYLVVFPDYGVVLNYKQLTSVR